MDKHLLIAIILKLGKDGRLLIRQSEIIENLFTMDIPFINILRKWNKFCVSYDFQENQAQVALNGKVSNILKNPLTKASHNGSFDDHLIRHFHENRKFLAHIIIFFRDSKPGSEMLLVFGRYAFSKNPFIGKLANLNVWNRAMRFTELQEKTQCNWTILDSGNVANGTSDWKVTGTLVKEISLNVNETNCVFKNTVNDLHSLQ